MKVEKLKFTSRESKVEAGAPLLFLDSRPLYSSTPRRHFRLLTLDFRLAEVSQQIHWASFVLLPRCGVVSQGRPVERVATFATVNLCRSPERLERFFLLPRRRETMRIVVIPTLEVADAKLSLRVFLITSSLAGLLLFDLDSHVTPRN